MERSAFISKMFEAGAQLKAQYGEDKVCDFSLGNPTLKPPVIFSTALNKLAALDFPGKHAYMPNAGYTDVREVIAAAISREQGIPVSGGRVVMTCGAGGALNIALKTLLDPGDQVLVSIPCFVDYGFYVDNHGGALKAVKCKKDFDLDVDVLAENITVNTKAIIINSPNNPSGRVYPEATIRSLGEMLTRKSKELNRPIYLISDEPYKRITYQGIIVPAIFPFYKNSIIVNSYSKALSIPGERIGWLAVHPHADDAEDIYKGCVLCNRILGYVNAPALMQKVIAEVEGTLVDVREYEKKRDFLCKELKRIGYQFREPDGAFYIFAQAPGGDDIKTVAALREQLILVAPGTGYGMPGYFRIAFCTDDAVIERALPGFEKVFRA